MDESALFCLTHGIYVLGAKDLYISDGATWIGGPGNLSLMGSGSKGKSDGGNGYTGTAPSPLDPYYIADFGFVDVTVATSAQTEYTLYSHETGKYNIIRVNTPNPSEYYLIENRSSSEGSYDDNGNNEVDGNGHIQGIVIWHIDEISMNSYTRPNNGGQGHDLGMTVLSQTGDIYDCDENTSFSSLTDSFDIGNYTFSTTETWYTILNADQAKDFNVKIEFLSEPGEEMKIKIDGIYDMAAQFMVSQYNSTTTSIGLRATISNYFGNTIESCTISLSRNEDMSDAIVKTAEILEEDIYGALFEGLTPGTAYYYKIEMVGSLNSRTVTGETLTMTPRTNYTIYVYKGLSENDRAYKVKVDFGEKFTYSFPMNKSGYAFCGWYLDKELTQKYDMNFTQNEAKDFDLYAKWVPEGEVATLKLVDATATNKIFSVYPGETFVTPEIEERNGYEFEGWFADAEYTTPFDFSAPVTQTGTVNVYAKWNRCGIYDAFRFLRSRNSDRYGKRIRKMEES